MPDISVVAVLAATVAGLVLSGAWYAALGARLATASGATAAGSMPPWKVGVELVRNLVLATVLAGLASRGDIDGAGGGVLLGLALWIAFPVVLWTGAIIHEGTPWRLAAIHGGDWLLKLVLLAAMVSAWH
jgi:Protein of unknown function (DUF1761)